MSTEYIIGYLIH